MLFSNGLVDTVSEGLFVESYVLQSNLDPIFDWLHNYFVLQGCYISVSM